MSVNSRRDGDSCRLNVGEAAAKCRRHAGEVSTILREPNRTTTPYLMSASWADFVPNAGQLGGFRVLIGRVGEIPTRGSWASGAHFRDAGRSWAELGPKSIGIVQDRFPPGRTWRDSGQFRCPGRPRHWGHIPGPSLLGIRRLQPRSARVGLKTWPDLGRAWLDIGQNGQTTAEIGSKLVDIFGAESG